MAIWIPIWDVFLNTFNQVMSGHFAIVSFYRSLSRCPQVYPSCYHPELMQTFHNFIGFSHDLFPATEHNIGERRSASYVRTLTLIYKHRIQVQADLPLMKNQGHIRLDLDLNRGHLDRIGLFLPVSFCDTHVYYLLFKTISLFIFTIPLE